MYLAVLLKVDDITNASSFERMFPSVLVALVEAFDLRSVAVIEFHEPVAHATAMKVKYY